MTMTAESVMLSILLCVVFLVGMVLLQPDVAATVLTYFGAN